MTNNFSYAIFIQARESIMNIVKILEKCDSVLWDGFLIYILVFVGVFLTFKLRFMQFKYLGYSLKLAFSRHDDKAQGDISQFESLMMAMAATIGIGSIAGISTAIIAGGFGAIFWMWVVALFGMATKYAEALLAVKYRIVDERGQMCGGPMYYIKKGLKWKWLAFLFAFFGLFASFAGGNLIQAQSISDAMYELIAVPPYITGIVLSITSAIIILGGIKSLGKVNAILVPVMACLYMLGGIIIIIVRIEHLPEGVLLIFKSAFNREAVGGGFLGASVMAAVQMGIARGIASNEAGLGSAPIAAAAAKTDVPGRQALISMSGVFLSSFVVCTITALVLAVTNVVGQLDATGKLLNGAPLVMNAFSSVIPGGKYIVALGLVLFGFSTIIGWSYYGEKCVEYLAGEKFITFYRIVFLIVVLIGALLTLEVVWPIADILNGLMALPNLVGLVFMSGIVSTESVIFFDLIKMERRKK